VWYRIHLTVTDSGGLHHSLFRDVVPRVVQLTLTSVPVGRPLLLDSQSITTPHVTPSVEGVVRNIEAQSHTEGSLAYTFTGWSDGGPPRHDIVTPTENATYTATFGTATAAPTAFTLSANGATLTAAWNRVGGSTSYRLDVGTAAGLSNLLTLDVGDISFIEGVVPVGTYFARVRAIHPSGISGPSNEGSAQVTTSAVCVSPPPVPANYVARAGGLTAGLSWLPSAAATAYVLEVGSQAGASDLLVTNLGNVTSFVATASAGNYFTRIRAVNACGASAPSAEAPVVLACTADAVVPTGLTVSRSGGIATFAWQAPLGATGYRLHVGSAPGVTNLLDADIGTATSLAVPLAGVPLGVYYVRIAATSACGVGLPSNEVTLQVP
jgi:predicted phage tail protein